MYGNEFDETLRFLYTKTWFNKLFDEYSIYPYMDIAQDGTKKLLFKKSIFSKLVPVFTSRLKITRILNDAIGIDILSEKRKGIIEEIAETIFKEKEAQLTINDRIKNISKSIMKKNLYFCGLSQKFQSYNDIPALESNSSESDGKFICLEGTISHKSAIEHYNPNLAQSLSKDIEWVIADCPFFQMIPENMSFKGFVVGLNFKNRLPESIYDIFPFSERIGWYPYIRLYGVFHKSHSIKYPTLKTIDFCFMQIRIPQAPDALSAQVKNILPKEAKSFDTTDEKYRDKLKDISETLEGFDWQKKTKAELLLLLSVIFFSYMCTSQSSKFLRGDLQKLASRIFTFIGDEIPVNLCNFFNREDNMN